MDGMNLRLANDIEHIVFDWNGTLLDDLALAIECVNRCAVQFGVKPVTRDGYRDAFYFPISDFYAKIGFDLERTPFPAIVKCYLEYFDMHVIDCSLHVGVSALLETIQRSGISVSILSASHFEILKKALLAKNILDCFTHIVGLTDNFAASKCAKAIELHKKIGGNPVRTLFVGDTLHDYEVAKAVGWTPVLVATGHQSLERLLKAGAPVLKDLHELSGAFPRNIESGLPDGRSSS